MLSCSFVISLLSREFHHNCSNAISFYASSFRDRPLRQWSVMYFVLCEFDEIDVFLDVLKLWAIQLSPSFSEETDIEIIAQKEV